MIDVYEEYKGWLDLLLNEDAAVSPPMETVYTIAAILTAASVIQCALVGDEPADIP